MIHQALCGELNKAWDLIDTTLDDLALAKKIAFKTDLQDSPPSGVLWSPIIRGFAYEKFYLIIKTYLDTSENVRNGRVFSHCLIIDAEDLVGINDLRPLFQFFQSQMNKALPIKPFSFQRREDGIIGLAGSQQGRFNKVIQNFLTLESFSNTVIWTGLEDYEIAISRFWQLLDPTQKGKLNFGINFNPSEIPKEKLNFITVPETIEVKFENKGFCVVKKTDNVVLSEFSEQYLAGEANFETRLKSFATEFAFGKFEHKDVPIIAKGVNTFENLKATKDLRVLNTFANIVAKYAADESQGEAGKIKVMAQITNRFKTAEPTELLLVKNFPVKSFKDSQNQLAIVTKEWMDKSLFNDKMPKGFNSANFVLQVFESATPNWWTEVFKNKVKELFVKGDLKAAKIFWNWFVEDEEILKKIAGFLSQTASFEEHLINSLPKDLSKSSIHLLKAFVVNAKWFKLYAALSKKELDFKKSIAAQLQVDRDPSSIQGLILLSQGQPGNDVVAVATGNDDDRLIDIAVKTVIATPQLMTEINLESLQWQKIWVKVIQGGLAIEKSVTDAEKKIHQFFDQLVKGKTYNKELLLLISESDFANILNYGKRSSLWTKLPKEVKDRFLVKTSSVFLEQLAKNSTISVPEEKDLADYIQKSAIGTFLYYNRNNIKSALPIFIAYRQLPENNIKQYVENYGGAIDVIDAAQLGRLAAQRHYENLAYAIYHKTSYHKNFKIALGECYSLMDFFHRGLAWASGAIKHIEVSKDEWWSSFAEISYKLYSGGPTENKIWKQADGEEYDLLVKGTGKEVWIAALNKLRNGGCTGITTKKLMKKMIAEHKRVTELSTLKELYKKI